MKWVLRVLSWLGFVGFALWLVAKAAGAGGLGKSLIDLPDFALFGALSQWRIDSDLTPVVILVVGFAVGLAFVVLSLSGLARWLADAAVSTVVALGIVGLGVALAQSGDRRPLVACALMAVGRLGLAWRPPSAV